MYHTMFIEKHKIYCTISLGGVRDLGVIGVIVYWKRGKEEKRKEKNRKRETMKEGKKKRVYKKKNTINCARSKRLTSVSRMETKSRFFFNQYNLLIGMKQITRGGSRLQKNK